MTTVKFKKCKECKEKFLPQFFNQKYCFKEKCREIEIKAVLDRQKRIGKQKWGKRKQEMKKSLKTHSNHVQELQAIFNKFIRLRDKVQRCISCNTHLKGKYDAGHLFSTGQYPELRFHEDNVHGQCVFCNRHLHGNTTEYLLNLPNRIGKEKVEKLKTLRGVPSKLSIPEIEDKKMYYKLKIKEFESKIS